MITESLEKLSRIEPSENPFPGLRPFELHESHLFFGRQGQSEKLLAKLQARHFLAVVGTSGSGKSSLVRAGLLPGVLGGMMDNAGSNWRVAVMRPGNDPIGNLSRALNSTEVFGSDQPDNAAVQAAVTEETLRRGNRGLIESVRLALRPADENLLVVVDQFEELFRFAKDNVNVRYQNDAAAFVKLLLEAVKPEGSGQHEANIFVVLTMRSDFLGDCSQFRDLPEEINESQYLIPRLTRDQLREVIEGPVAVGGGQIAPRLVNQLLNDIVDDQDQLPILQHALMRTWDHWQKTTFVVPPSGGNGSSTDRLKAELQSRQPIELKHYQAIGGMAQALSMHANEAYEELPGDSYRLIAKKMFKALTGKGEDNREIRRPVVFRELCEVIQADPEQVKIVINAFVQPSRSFLMPIDGSTLHHDTRIDISHESLIRNWRGKSELEEDKRLSEWMDDESESAKEYRFLVESVRRGTPLRDNSLRKSSSWWKRNKPNAAWARRYDQDERTFYQALNFLEQSEENEKNENEEKDKQKLRNDVLIRNPRISLFATAIYLGLGLFLILFVHSLQMPPGWPPSSLQTQGFLEWAITQVNASIYWAWFDALWVSQRIFDQWSGIHSPLIKLGILFVSILLVLNFRLLLKRRVSIGQWIMRRRSP